MDSKYFPSTFRIPVLNHDLCDITAMLALFLSHEATSPRGAKKALILHSTLTRFEVMCTRESHPSIDDVS